MFNNGGMRNLGANAQPAADHQPERLPDLRQRHARRRQAHDEGRRQLYASLARDSERRHDRRPVRLQPEPDVELRRHHRRLHAAREHRVRRRQLPARLREHRQPDACSTPGTYTELRPEFAAYFQDDIRLTSRLTVNAGLRWDVYVPWVEENNKQSNFDVSTGRFVVASDDAVINGVQVGRYLQTYSKTDFGPRLGFAYDLNGSGRTIVRGGYGLFWNFTPGGTSSSKAQNQPFLQAQASTTNFGTNIMLSNGLAAPPAVNPDRRAGRVDAVGVPHRLPRRARAQLQRQRAAAVRHQLHGRGGLLGLAHEERRAQDRPEPGAADRRRDRSEREPAVRGGVAGAADRRRAVEHRLRRVQRPADEVPAPVGEPLLVPELVHVRPRDRPELGQRRHRHADGHLQSRIQPRAGRLRRDAHVQLELDLRAAVGAPAEWYGGWQVSGILYLRSGLPITITSRRACSRPASPTTGRTPSAIRC